MDVIRIQKNIEKFKINKNLKIFISIKDDNLKPIIKVYFKDFNIINIHTTFCELETNSEIISLIISKQLNKFLRKEKILYLKKKIWNN